ncbi:cobalamin B12-binding domain-containing protein [Chloroflexota bacterium]
MSVERKRIKVLMAKASLDGHWRGVLVVSMALRDAGMEVIYGGALSAAQIAEAAIEEGVDVIGINIGAGYTAVQELVQLLHERGANDVLVVAGGTIPHEDIPRLKQMGVAGVFPPGSSLDSIVSFIRENVKASL